MTSLFLHSFLLFFYRFPVNDVLIKEKRNWCFGLLHFLTFYFWFYCCTLFFKHYIYVLFLLVCLCLRSLRYRLSFSRAGLPDWISSNRITTWNRSMWNHNKSYVWFHMGYKTWCDVKWWSVSAAPVRSGSAECQRTALCVLCILSVVCDVHAE